MSGGGGFYAGKGGKGGGGGAAPSTSPPLPGALKRKLAALSYPEVDAATLTGQAYCKIVLWLEEEKIRLYEKHDRKALRDFGKAWYTHAADYAKDLGIPAEGLNEKNAAVKLNVLNGLTNLAIHDIYRDKVEANELSSAAPPKAAAESERQKLRDLIEPLNRLLESFSLPKLPQDAADQDTIAGLRCIHARVCPPNDTGNQGAQLDLDQLPVGFDVSDPEVKRAATILRLLHGIELQQLQVHINGVINELQQLTADPKTDARLGRVGR